MENVYELSTGTTKTTPPSIYIVLIHVGRYIWEFLSPCQWQLKDNDFYSARKLAITLFLYCCIHIVSTLIYYLDDLLGQGF